MNKIAFIFPAFVLKYLNSEIKLLTDHNANLSEKLNHISSITGVNIRDFDVKKNNYINDELKNQLVTYLVSCIYSDILKSKSTFPSNISSISMGLYSALYCAESISLTDGAVLIKRIYELLYKQFYDRKFKMATVTGFSYDDISYIIKERGLNIEIVVKNNQHSYTIAAAESEISEFHNISIKEGAIHFNIFPVSIPYHSKFINTKGFREKIFDGISIDVPLYKVISSIDQAILSHPGKIKSEIIRNLTSFIDWYKTKTTLIETGIKQFIECGPGDSLKRISRFIDGDHKVINLSKLV